MLAATTTQAGYLNPSDFNTFNDKQTEITLTTTGGSGAATFNAATGALNIPVYNVSSGTNFQTGNVVWDSQGYDVTWEDYGTATFTNRQATTGTYQAYQTNMSIGDYGYRLSQASNDINLGGSVTLNQPYQATVVSTLDTPPTVALTINNITPNMIDNMFIVNPPFGIEGEAKRLSTLYSTLRP